MKTYTLLKAGVAGSVIAALCCFTPILVILLGGVGLSAWITHLDAVLLPSLFLFIALTIYAFLKQDKEACCQSKQPAMLCYCFDISKAAYQTALNHATTKSIKDFVVQQTQNKQCACECRNPSGRCCLVGFKQMEKAHDC